MQPVKDLVQSLQIFQDFEKITEEDEVFLDVKDNRLAAFENQAPKFAESEIVAAGNSGVTTGSQDGSNESIDDEEPVLVEDLGRGRRQVSFRFIVVLAAERANVGAYLSSEQKTGFNLTKADLLTLMSGMLVPEPRKVSTHNGVLLAFTRLPVSLASIQQTISAPSLVKSFW